MMPAEREENETAAAHRSTPDPPQANGRTIWLWLMLVSVFGILIPPTVGIFASVSAINETMERARLTHAADVESITRSLSGSFATTAVGITISVGFLALFAFSFGGWIASGRVAKRRPHS